MDILLLSANSNFAGIRYYSWNTDIPVFHLLLLESWCHYGLFHGKIRGEPEWYHAYIWGQKYMPSYTTERIRVDKKSIHYSHVTRSAESKTRGTLWQSGLAIQHALAKCIQTPVAWSSHCGMLITHGYATFKCGSQMKCLCLFERRTLLCSGQDLTKVLHFRVGYDSYTRIYLRYNQIRTSGHMRCLMYGTPSPVQYYNPWVCAEGPMSGQCKQWNSTREIGLQHTI